MVDLYRISNKVIYGQTWERYAGTGRIFYGNSGGSGIDGQMELWINRKAKSIVEIYGYDQYFALVRRTWYGNVNCDPEKYRNSGDSQSNNENMLNNFVETYNEARFPDFM